MNTPRSALSLNLREIFLLITIIALILGYFVNRTYQAQNHVVSKALFTQEGPIRYRFWHQYGPEGSGTGAIGSGNEWKNAEKLEFFENFVIIYEEDGWHRMVERADLRWFDWQSIDPPASSASGGASSGH